jgi:hypothetical protein
MLADWWDLRARGPLLVSAERKPQVVVAVAQVTAVTLVLRVKEAMEVGLIYLMSALVVGPDIMEVVEVVEVVKVLAAAVHHTLRTRHLLPMFQLDLLGRQVMAQL